MKCEQCLKLLSPYLDNEISSAESVQIKEHLMTCSTCAQELKLLEMICDQIGELETAELPERFHEELMDKITEEAKVLVKPRKFRPHQWVYWAGGMAATVLVGMGWLLKPPVTTPEQVPMNMASRSTRQIDQTQATPFEASMPMEDTIEPAAMSQVEQWTVSGADNATIEKYVGEIGLKQGYSIQSTYTSEMTSIRIEGITNKKELKDTLEKEGLGVTTDQACESQTLDIIIKK